jgi:hypothetical protein
MIEFSDPRTFPDPATTPPAAARVHTLATMSLSARAEREADARDGEIDAELARLIEAGDGDALAAVLASTPSVAVHRHVWRALARRLAQPVDAASGVGVALFALPVVLVTGRSAGATGCRLPGVLHDIGELAAHLRAHGALGGSEVFALANALVAVTGIDARALPGLVAASRLGSPDATFAPIALPRAPVDVPEGEAAHLRFVVGSALAAPGFDLGRHADKTAWMRPFALSLGRQLAVPGISVLALPRPPQSLPAALASGKAAQRDVSAQLFASNAVRQLRASVGEPAAVISAHRAADASGGGELRLSLSSPFEPRDAQGFRCPVYPWERVVDVATMLVELLHDCRVDDIRTVAGVHADRDPLTGGPLLFKPETLPPAFAVTIH